MSTIKPQQDYLLVEIDDKPSQTESGLFIPDSADVNGGVKVGTVVAVGPGRQTEYGYISEPQYKEGDKVVFEEHILKEFSYGREKVRLIRNHDIMASVED